MVQVHARRQPAHPKPTKTAAPAHTPVVSTSTVRSASAPREPADLDEVWAAYKKTGDAHLRNRLIEVYYPLVRYISERLLATLPRSIDLDDLTSAGLFGLMDAIDGFDTTRGIKFKTYCTTRIRGSILDELRSQDWVPRLVRLKANKINRAWKTLEARTGREPTDEEMALELGVGMDEYQDMSEESNAITMFSLSDKFDDQQEDGGLENSEVVADEKSLTPLEKLHRRDVIEVLTRNLSHKEKRIVIMYYYEGLTMKEIGKILDLTESRVCQIHSNVILRLKEQATRKLGRADLSVGRRAGLVRAACGVGAAALMVGLWFESADPSPGPQGLHLHAGVWNFGHFAAFAVLASLLVRAFARDGGPWGLGTAAGRWAWAVCIAYGFTDEVHQFFTPGRCCSLYDVSLDALGSAFALLTPWPPGPGRSPRWMVPAGLLAVGIAVAVTTGYTELFPDPVIADTMRALGFRPGDR